MFHKCLYLSTSNFLLAWEPVNDSTGQDNQCIQFQIRQSVQSVGRNVTEPQIAVWTLVRFAVSSAMV